MMTSSTGGSYLIRVQHEEVRFMVKQHLLKPTDPEYA